MCAGIRVLGLAGGGITARWNEWLGIRGLGIDLQWRD